MKSFFEKLLLLPSLMGRGWGRGLVLLLLVSSCSTKQADYTNAIPSDASQVVEINLKSLADKAGLNDKENRETLQRLTDALRSGMNAATYQQMEAIVKDPAKSGMDFDEPVYIFNAPELPTPMLVAKVKSEKDLRRLLETLQQEQICNPLTEADGYSYTQIDRQAVIAFTPTTLLFVPTAETKATEQIPALLAQTADKSLTASTVFKQMQKQGGDINLLLSLTDLPKPYLTSQAADLADDADLEELKIIGGLSFLKGKIELTLTTYTHNSTLKAQLQKPLRCTAPIDNAFLKYLPKSTLALFTIGLNGSELYNLIGSDAFLPHQPQDFMQEWMPDIFNAFRGDLTVALINVTVKGEPSIVAYADVKKDTPLTTLYEKRNELGLSRGEEIVRLTDSDYLYKSRRRTVFFGIREKRFYATNDELIYKNLFKPADPSLKAAAFASEMKGNRIAAVLNAEAILDLPIVKVLAGIGGANLSTYYNLLANVAYLEVLADEDRATLTIQLKDKDTNALRQLADYLKQFLSLY